MPKKIALITGITGQDGAYLAKFLLKKKYKVIGAERRSARSNNWRLEKLNIANKVIIEDIDMKEINNLIRLFNKYKFDEVYNLAAQSFVGTSFSSPINTANITGLGSLRILETIRSINPKIKFYQASSSEMFGDVLEKRQKEKTPLNPQSPYAISKVFSHYLTKNYRNSYNMFAASGILFNHESPLRGEEFVTRKIIIGLVKILKKEINHFELGNIYAKRDWGYAKEYVEAMWLMLQQDQPDDYVIATNETHTVREFLEETFRCLDLDWNEYVGFDKKYERPAEVDLLIGNPQKAKNQLGWEPQTTFKDLVALMVDEDMKLAQREKTLAEANLS